MHLIIIQNMAYRVGNPKFITTCRTKPEITKQ